MPTARELLEQADALMRRNRGDAGIPVLTDSVPEAQPAPARGGASTRASADGRPLREAVPRDDRARAAPAAQAGPPMPDLRAPLRDRGAGLGAGTSRAAAGSRPEVEPPLLTDVAQVFGASPLGQAEGEPSLWLGPDTIDPTLHSITGPSPDTVGVVPPMTLRVPDPVAAPRVEDDPDPTVTRTLRAAGSAPTPPPAGSTPPAGSAPPPPAELPAAEPAAASAASDEARWHALSEQISMQVLQRLDLFVDVGLKAQLASHLQPIVARAGAELVEAINDHVGQLVRTYIAEAIEREIAQWRLQNK